MPKKLYIINLTDDERHQLLDLAHDGASDEAIAASLHVGRATVQRIRKRFVEGNLARALNEDHRPGPAPTLDDKQEAWLIATACSTPPGGRDPWTMQLLADEMVRLKQIESISHDTVRRILKKTCSNVAEGGMVHFNHQPRLCLALGRSAGPLR